MLVQTLPTPPPLPAAAAALVTADAAYEDLCRAVLAHDRAIPDRLAALLAADPQHVRGWALKALFAVMLARSELLPAAREAAAVARAALAGDASRGDARYVEAAGRAVTGDWAGAIDALERALDLDPSDALAAKLSHGLRFMLGDADGMARSIGRALARIDREHRHVGFLLGCKAFALEETHRYQEAELVGRAAIEREPADAWGLHAVSHVHEMTGRAAEGLAWIEAHPRAVDRCNNFRFHLVWHKALFRLELGDAPGALRLYDSGVRPERTDDYRDIANAASLLSRLEIAGLDVAGRWDELAALCARRIDDRSLVFADLHYVMALAGAGRTGAARALAASLAGAPARSDAQGEVARRAGAMAAEALIDHAQGRYADCARRLLAAAPAMQAIGGSHAQRDVFEQVMLDAMVRSGHPQAQPLLLARLAKRAGRNGFAAAMLARLAPTPARRRAG